MALFKKIFGHERDATGKTLDRTVIILSVVGVLIWLYASHG
jgi:hypothetical protein